jgi:predicted Zn-dependent protease
MRSSTYVEDIDQKEQHLCAGCRSELNVQEWNLQFGEAQNL